MTSQEWLTAKEAAQYLKVKTRSLLLWVRQGKVQAYALSGTRRRKWRFRQQDLDDALRYFVDPCIEDALDQCQKDYGPEWKHAAAQFLGFDTKSAASNQMKPKNGAK